MRKFYRTNASLFFISFGIAAGFMRGEDHIAIGEMFVSSAILLSIPIAIWLGYTLHAMKFNRDELRQEANELILNTVLLSKAQQWQALVIVTSYQLLPVIFYAGFLIILSTLHGFVVSVSLIIVTTSVLIMIASIDMYRTLHNPNQEKTQTMLTHLLRVNFTKPFATFSIEWIIRKQFLVFVGTKIFSVLILYGITILYKIDTYDFRLLAMGIVIAFTAQINLVQEIHRFDYYHFTMLRNLPLTFLNRLTYLITTILILMIPEIGLLLKSTPEVFNILYIAEALLLMISILVMFYGILFIKERSQEQLMTVGFFMAMGWIVIILFKVPAISIALVNFLIGLFLMRKYVYTVEYPIENN